MHISQSWLNWLTCFLLPLNYDTLWRHAFTFIHIHTSCDLFFIPISFLQRERWSQEQCKLGKMFRKVAFPTGTSQLQLWVSTLCVSVCVWVHVCEPTQRHTHTHTLLLHLWVWERQLFCLCLSVMKVCTPGCVCSSLFVPGCRGLQTRSSMWF